jgi:RimJ/RimL family protein N-acetyltransferase
MWADPIVTRHIGGVAFTAEQTWHKLLRYAGLWSLLGFGYWCVVDRASGRFVGEVGFADFHRDIDPPFGDAPEAGWVLAPWAHRKGFATEALGAAIRWLDENRAPKRSVCLIDAENVASIRVAEKCGYAFWCESQYHGTPSRLFERVHRAPPST